MTLKTGVKILKIQLCSLRNKLHFKIYYNRNQLFHIVIIFHNIAIFTKQNTSIKKQKTTTPNLIFNSKLISHNCDFISHNYDYFACLHIINVGITPVYGFLFYFVRQCCVCLVLYKISSRACNKFSFTLPYMVCVYMV